MDQSRDKKLGQLMAHVPDDAARQVKTLAEFSGMTSSEYVRQFIMEHLESERAKYRMLAQVFEGQGSDGSERTESNQ